jgi:signal transduction histidine kinase
MDIDITERRRMEKQLKDAERLAAIGMTAGMVGHDIRNPLQAITGDIFLLKSELTSFPESEEKKSMRESLDGIDENVHYVNKIVQDLQDYARPINPVATEVDAYKILCEDALFKNGILENIGATCRVEKQAKKLVTDPEILRRVLCNLVNNAVQAMPNGGKLDVYAYQEAGDTVFVVQDTGAGIPEAIRPNLFTPLFTTKSRGQGFGLAVAKRMTEALGGTLNYESEVDKGTKFILRLPSLKK